MIAFRRTLRVVALLVTCVGLLQAQASAAPVPVVKCTFLAPSGALLVPAPPTVRSDLSPSLAGRVALYTVGSFGAVAPRGWHCLGFAEPGGVSVFITPEKLAARPADIRGRIGMDLEIFAGYGTHYVQVIEAGAPLFRSLRDIARTAPKNPPLPAAARLQPIRGEAITAITPTVVRFCDPPHLRGSSRGSGGAYESCGIASQRYARPRGRPPLVKDLHLLSITLADRAFMKDLLRANLFI